MIFGKVAVDDAEGAILAHSLRLSDRRLRKGTRLAMRDLALLRAAGIGMVIAARLQPGDLTEDEAAARIGAALATFHIRAAEAATGRVNLFADRAGLFLPDRAIVDRLNGIDPAISLATLGEHAPVEPGRMLATVKIIPLAVSGASVDAAVAALAQAPAFRLAPFRARRVALIQTELATVKPSVLDKTRDVTAARLGASHSVIVSERRCAHEAGALSTVLAEPVDAELTLIFGASAVIDSEDVIPAAIRSAGGRVDTLGMPVDPGNLLLLGSWPGTRCSARLVAPAVLRKTVSIGYSIVCWLILM